MKGELEEGEPSVCGEAMGTAGGDGERSWEMRLLPVELLRLEATLEVESPPDDVLQCA